MNGLRRGIQQTGEKNEWQLWGHNRTSFFPNQHKGFTTNFLETWPEVQF